MSDRLQKRILLDDGAARRLFLAYSRDDLDAVTELFSANKKADLHLVKPFDDVAFVAEVEAKLAAAERKQASTTQEFIDIGRMLSERKVAGKRDGSIPHGEWVPWLEKNFPHRSYTRLSEYMRVAEAMEDGDTKIRMSEFLPRGLDAVLGEVRRLKAAEKRPPKPIPLIKDVTGADLQILVGDCRARLQQLPDESVDCCITSPPYFRTLVYPGSFTVFGGDSGCCEHEWQMQSKNYGGWHQRTTGLNDRHKTKNEEKMVERGTCKKCGAESVMLGWEDTVAEYIDHLVQIFAEIKRVLKPGGVFWLNIGDKVAEKNSLDIPERLLLALKDNGWRCPAKIIWHIPNKMPSSVSDRPNCDYEMVYMLVNQTDYNYDGEAVREPAKCADDSRRGKRIDYNGKYDGKTGFGQQSFASIREDGMRNLRSVWSIPSDRMSKYSHCCPFPKKLVRRMVLAGCPKGRRVLDLFAGSGTTGLVALANDRKAVLIEANPQFAAEAQDRIEKELEEYAAKCAGQDAWGEGDDDEMGEAVELETAE